MLDVIYDLAVSPPTWDFARCLNRALIHRRGQEPVRVWIVPGPKDGFRDDQLPPDLAGRRRMLEKVVLRYCELWPDVAPVVLQDREDVFRVLAKTERCWPEGYSPLRPQPMYFSHHVLPELFLHWRAFHDLPVLQIPPAFRTWAAEIVRDPRTVLLVLRECDYWPSRNSQVEAWRQFAEWLQVFRGVPALVVRDTAHAWESLERVETCPWAAEDLRLLAALTQRVAVSYWINNGPACLVEHGNPAAAYRLLRPASGGAPCADAAYWAACGVSVGSSLAFAGPHQRFVWQDDTLETLQTVYDRGDA